MKKIIFQVTVYYKCEVEGHGTVACQRLHELQRFQPKTPGLELMLNINHHSLLLMRCVIYLSHYCHYCSVLSEYYNIGSYHVEDTSESSRSPWCHTCKWSINIGLIPWYPLTCYSTKHVNKLEILPATIYFQFSL